MDNPLKCLLCDVSLVKVGWSWQCHNVDCQAYQVDLPRGMVVSLDEIRTKNENLKTYVRNMEQMMPGCGLASPPKRI